MDCAVSFTVTAGVDTTDSLFVQTTATVFHGCYVSRWPVRLMWSLTDRRRNGDDTQTRNCEKQASDIYREETVLQSDSYGDINVFIDVASDCLLTSGDINGRGIIEELLRLYNYMSFPYIQHSLYNWLKVSAFRPYYMALKHAR